MNAAAREPRGSGDKDGAEKSLRRLAVLRVRAGQGDPAELDAQIRELITLENEIASRLGELLAKMNRERKAR